MIQTLIHREETYTSAYLALTKETENR